ncbi:MAG: hypothetical protein JSS49_11215 [Planctomycetes bacterium]|nr:hypothetical protein [Planctomycetota bacterium]
MYRFLTSRLANCGGLIVASLSVLLMATAFGGDVPPELEMIRQGYLANRSSFTHGKCSFVYSIQSADTESAAIEGKWNGLMNHLERESTLYFDGDALTIKVELDGHKLATEMASPDGLIVPLTIARKGPFAIDHDPIVNTAIVHSPANSRLAIRYQPFNLASDSDGVTPASAIDYAAARNFAGATFNVETDVLYEGRKYIKMTKKAVYDSHDVAYWIDPDRGYLNFITEYTEKGTGKLSHRMRILDVQEDQGRFFPKHAIKVFPMRTSTGLTLVEVREMRVTDLDLSYKPTAEDLTIHLPKHTQYSDGINPNSSKSLFRSNEAEFAPIHVDEIEGIYNQLMGLVVERTKEDAASAAVRNPGQSVQRRSSLYWLAGVNLAVVAVVVAIFFRRRRPPEKSP